MYGMPPFFTALAIDLNVDVAGDASAAARLAHPLYVPNSFFPERKAVQVRDECAEREECEGRDGGIHGETRKYGGE